MAFAEDLDLFFDTDEFAVTAWVDGAEDDQFPVIFDRAQIEALGIGNGISGTEPMALVRSADVAGHQIRAGSTLRIPLGSQVAWGSQEFWGGGPFRVKDVQPDGTGLTLLMLTVVA